MSPGNHLMESKKANELPDNYKEKYGRAIRQYDKRKNLISCYPSVSSASRETGIAASSINRAITGEQFYAGDYIWISELDTQNPSVLEEKLEKHPKVKEKAVLKFAKDGKFINRFESAKEAGRVTGIPASQITSCCNGRNLTSGGFIWLKEQDPNLQDHLLGKIGRIKNHKKIARRGVLQCNLDGFPVAKYESIRKASKETGTSVTSIEQCVSGAGNIANGMLWFDINDENLERHIKETVEKISSISNPANESVPVVQLTLDEKYIAEFPSITEAARKVNVSKSCIDDTLRGKQHTCGGYKWQYAKDYYKKINKDKGENK